MESLMFRGRRIGGFGVGDAGAMTPQEAANVGQGALAPSAYGVMGALGGGAAGLLVGSLVLVEWLAPRGSPENEEYGGVLLAASVAAGVAVGAGIGGAAAGRYGRRQQRAAEVLASATPTPSP